MKIGRCVPASVRRFGPVVLSTVLLVALACSGDDGDTGPPGPPGSFSTETDLSQGDDLPGLSVTIQSLSGGSASGGRFRVGDKVRVNYRLQKSDGTDWDIAELSSGRALVSGPTFNYQRVLLEQTDLVTASKKEKDGTYTYTFASKIPAVYEAPINDTPAFGEADGELTGKPLLEGTYTLGVTFSWDFTVDGESERDAANATMDFVLGSSGSVEPREVVKIESCNRCHEQLRIHGGRREDARLCVLCHTSGAESDGNVSIDFKVMIHKIHSGEHLPSVLGVATNDDGSRNYAADPVPYVVGGNDFSTVPFPAWPQGLVPTPRDQGYSALFHERVGRCQAFRPEAGDRRGAPWCRAGRDDLPLASIRTLIDREWGRVLAGDPSDPGLPSPRRPRGTRHGRSHLDRAVVVFRCSCSVASGVAGLAWGIRQS